MIYALFFILGFLVSCGVWVFIRSKHEAVGKLIINTKDPEKEVITLQVDDIEGLYTKKRIVFDIINEDTLK